MTYSVNFRRKVLAIKVEEKLTFAQVSERFNVGKASVMRWSTCLVPKKTRNKAATKIDMQALMKDVQSYPDGYNYERAKRLKVSVTGIFHALKRLGVTYKKNTEASKSERRKTALLPTENRFVSTGR
jgi:transposase